MYEIIRPKSHDLWLQARSQGIGSSEVGTILGVNPFDTAYKLWRRKKGLDAPIQENEAMRAGHLLESAVAQYFEEETGYKVIKASAGDWLAIDKQKPFLRVSPDRTYWLDSNRSKDNKGIVECKTTQLEIDEDNIPQHWFVQLTYQLGVMGYREGSLAWLTRGRSFGTKRIFFDADLYAYMVEQIERFVVDYLQGDKEPPVTTVDDVIIKFAKSSDKQIIADEKIMQQVSILKSIKPQLDQLTKQKKECEDAIKLFMEENDTLTMSDAKTVLCTWKSAKDSQKFDEKAFKADNPELYAKYLITTAGSRRFLLK